MLTMNMFLRVVKYESTYPARRDAAGHLIGVPIQVRRQVADKKYICARCLNVSKTSDLRQDKKSLLKMCVNCKCKTFYT